MANVDDDFEWVIDRGDADSIVMRYAGTSGAEVDLTGYSLELFDVASELSGKLTAEWADALTGRVRFKLQSIKNLPLRRSFIFRCAIIEPSQDRTKDRVFPKIRVVAV